MPKSTDAWDTNSNIWRAPSSSPSPSLVWQFGQPSSQSLLTSPCPEPTTTGMKVLLIADCWLKWRLQHCSRTDSQSCWYIISLKCVQQFGRGTQGDDATGCQRAHKLVNRKNYSRAWACECRATHCWFWLCYLCSALNCSGFSEGLFNFPIGRVGISLTAQLEQLFFYSLLIILISVFLQFEWLILI